MPTIYYRRTPSDDWSEWADRTGTPRDVRASAEDLLEELCGEHVDAQVRVGERGEVISQQSAVSSRDRDVERQAHRPAPEPQGLLF